jgi:hypothetical protein
MEMSESSLDDLREILAEGQRRSEMLLHRLTQKADVDGQLEEELDPLEIVMLLESLAVVDERRARVLERFRKAASTERQRQEERSIRQFVLGALSELEAPQTAGFLEDYVWVTELVEVKSRGTGSLRRDEYRAWHRRQTRPRVAYIVPCLNGEGRAVARWLSRSDWPLAQRMSVGRAEQMWTTRGVCALLEGYESASEEGRARFLPVIARWANEVVDDEESLEAVLSVDDFSRLKTDFRAHLRELEAEVVPLQERAAEELLDADEEELLWGVKEQ